MLLKLIGGIFIVLASGLMGIAMSNKFSSRPKEIRRLRTSLQMLETEILYAATPLPQAFRNIALRIDKPWSEFYQRISDHLMSGAFYGVSGPWSKGVEDVSCETALVKSDLELIKGFGNILGASDREDQKKHFELFYVQLKQQEDMAEEERKRSEKMYRSLGFLLGAAVFIILV